MLALVEGYDSEDEDETQKRKARKNKKSKKVPSEIPPHIWVYHSQPVGRGKTIHTKVQFYCTEGGQNLSAGSCIPSKQPK